MIVVGVDCATEPKKVGLALAEHLGGRGQLLEASIGTTRPALARTIVEWLSDGQPALLALDAPLGWPEPLGEDLARHSAGAPLARDAHRMFRRDTDRFVREKLGKQPLDVGADRIARTAHAALSLLEEVRKLSGFEIPLAWSSDIPRGAEAIEVYPAATLTARGLRASGYKAPADVAQRSEIIAGLEPLIAIAADQHDALLANADVLDAVLCTVAGFDFLEGRAFDPTDHELARREGWIWVPRI